MAEAADIIRQIYEGFDRGDLSPLLESLDPDVEWNEAEHVTFWPDTAFHGPDAIVQGLFARIAPTFGRTWKVHVERILVCGDTVIMQGRYNGKVRATGRNLSPQVAHIWDLAGDKIVRFPQRTDTWLFAEATWAQPSRRRPRRPGPALAVVRPRHRYSTAENAADGSGRSPTRWRCPRNTRAYRRGASPRGAVPGAATPAGTSAGATAAARRVLVARARPGGCRDRTLSRHHPLHTGDEQTLLRCSDCSGQERGA